MRWGALYIAWLIAFCGAILSLYFGEIVGLDPCRLCWYQRTALFPLVVILGMAAYRSDRAILSYAATLASIGLFFALYQTLEPYVPFLQREILCGKKSNCLDPVFSLFGFLNFSSVSAIGFTLILLFLWLAKKNSEESASK